MAQENFDYATELFRQCVWGDPGNRAFVQSFLGNLQKKYANNRKGSSLAQFKGSALRSAIKKAVAQSEWEEVIKNGLAVLKVNPWDVPALTAMATASENLAGMIPGEYIDCQWLYLRTAAEANPKDPDVCRACAMYLGKRGQFDQAINFWHRVEQARPDDEEPRRAIATLAVEKTLQVRRIGPEQDQRQGPPCPRGAGGRGRTYARWKGCGAASPAIPPTSPPTTNWPRSISTRISTRRPKTSCTRPTRPPSTTATSATSGTMPASATCATSACWPRGGPRPPTATRPGPKSSNSTGNSTSCSWRSTRAASSAIPTNLAFHFELGQQYKVLGQFGEAIKAFQNARNDARRKGVCMLYLGECFQAIKQYRLAMDHYESAIQEIPDRDVDNKKLGLYRAGKLALALKDLGKAEKNLGVLASMDFSYRDVSTLLDKVAASRDDEEGKGRGKDDRKDKGNNKDKGDEDQSDREDEPDGDDTNS